MTGDQSLFVPVFKDRQIPPQEFPPSFPLMVAKYVVLTLEMHPSYPHIILVPNFKANGVP